MKFSEIAAMGQEPKPTAIASFVVSFLETHGATKRHDLVQAIEREWASVGGAPIPRNKTTMRLKKSLSMLGEQGIAQNPMSGVYRLSQQSDELSNEDSVIEESDDIDEEHVAEVSVPDEVLADDDNPETSAELYIGQGDQYVYAFYLPTYKRLAQLDGNVRWPIKVGMTTTSVEVRMAAHRTALPERPQLGLIARTDNAALLEKVLQGILTIRGLRHDDAGGSEWFLTTPDELAALYGQVLGVDDGDGYLGVTP